MPAKARGSRRVKVATLLAAALWGGGTEVAAQRDVVVSPNGPVQTLGAAMRVAQPRARVIVRPGVYREPTIVVDRPVTIVGDPGAVLDGEGKRQIMLVRADDVTIRGLELRGVGTSHVE